MSVLRPFIIAFSMFTKIPMPHIEWDERSMRYMFGAFPCIGLLLALMAWGWQALGGLFSLGRVSTAIGYVILPLLVTGGIHMDGFCDVTDALSSYGDREKKLAILKDPHVGAFALIGTGVYLLSMVALYSEMQNLPLLPLLLGVVFGLSRCLAGIFVVLVPGAKSDGLSHTFSSGAAKRPVILMLAAWCALLIGAALWVDTLSMAAMALGLAIFLPLFLRMCKRQFGGFTGDLAGCLIQCSELLMLLCLLIAQRGAALL